MKLQIHLALLSIALCTLVVQAQPTLTANDFPTSPGTTLHFAHNDSVAVNLGANGVNQTWNFSAITATQLYEQDWINPSSAPRSNQFPTANRCVRVELGPDQYSYSFYSLTANVLWFLGTVSIMPDTLVTVYTTIQPLFQFPISYNNQWASVWSYDAGSGIVIYDSTFNVVDGWGTIVDITGNFSCLRVKSHTYILTRLFGQTIFTTTYWGYSWLVAGRGAQVVINSFTNENNPNFTVGEFNRLTDVTAVLPLSETRTMPTTLELNPAYPNPFNAGTQLTFTLPQSGDVSLKIYDAAGRQVSNLANGYFLPGAYQVSFDGAGLPSGTYFARLISGGIETTRSMTLLK